MTTLKYGILLLLLILAAETITGQTTRRLFKLVAENEEIPFIAEQNTIASELTILHRQVSHKKVLLHRVIKTKTNDRKPLLIQKINKQQSGFLTKLLHANLSLTFRISKTLKFKLSYI